MALSDSQAPALSTADARSWRIKLLYDGECPLCVREVNFLKKRDAKRGRVAFVDIAAYDYEPDDHQGIDYETAMGRIHGILPDGTVIQNVEVFRRVYEALDMGWVYAATQLPILGSLANWVYGLWADRRLALTGRPSLERILQRRGQQGRSPQRSEPGCDSSGRCHVED
ncbi:MAG: DUF393 domain-containing protein [Elainellaceae cyanobacterium]